MMFNTENATAIAAAGGAEPADDLAGARFLYSGRGDLAGSRPFGRAVIGEFLGQPVDVGHGCNALEIHFAGKSGPLW